jgi:hypothetical protein
LVGVIGGCEGKKAGDSGFFRGYNSSELGDLSPPSRPAQAADPAYCCAGVNRLMPRL